MKRQRFSFVVTISVPDRFPFGGGKVKRSDAKRELQAAIRHRSAHALEEEDTKLISVLATHDLSRKRAG